ncbi:hypothetical protein PM082_011007 [Marasmius tenuissimus]|nr:hypothetical protein PM082_011007 [Marasmius tenuissimus]
MSKLTLQSWTAPTENTFDMTPESYPQPSLCLWNSAAKSSQYARAKLFGLLDALLFAHHQNAPDPSSPNRYYTSQLIVQTLQKFSIISAMTIRTRLLSNDRGYARRRMSRRLFYDSHAHIHVPPRITSIYFRSLYHISFSSFSIVMYHTPTL